MPPGGQRPAYAGPRELTPGYPALLEVQQTGDFEAVLTWTLGLAGERPFRVLARSNPARIAIDIGHQP